MQTFLLPGIAAFGRTSSELFPIDARGIDEYLASVRSYEKIEIQPVLIQTDKPLEYGWQFSPSGGYSMVASGLGIYEVTLRDTKLGASDLLDVLHGMLAFMHSVSPNELIVIPIEKGSIPQSRIISLDDAVRIYKSTLPYTSDIHDYNAVFLSSWSRHSEFDFDLWRLVAYVIGDEEVVYASLFLRLAYEKYLFLADDIEDVILRHEEVPRRIIEAVDVENAIHNAYKVVEAIYGGTLSSDWDQVAKRLAAKGIDTTELVGYANHNIFKREPIIEKLKRLKHARDDRAAHGRIHQNRRNTYYELMDYQELARQLLGAHIQLKYPQTSIKPGSESNIR